MTSILHQEILPQHLSNYATSIDVRKLTLQTCGAIAKHVRDNDVEVLGVSLRLASDGTVDAVAFATPTVVFYLRSAGKPAMSSSSKTKGRILHVFIFLRLIQRRAKKEGNWKVMRERELF